MSAERTDEGIVLRRSDSGESDRRLTVFTPEFGKVSLLARGARKSGSRLSGSSEPLTYARFTWVPGRVRNYITQAQPLTGFPGLRTDYDRLLVGLALAETADLLLPAESPAPELYEMFGAGLERAATHLIPEVPLVWCEARMMETEGAYPDWTVCHASGEVIDREFAFVSAVAGGAVSARMAASYVDSRPVRWEALAGLNKIIALEEPPAKFGAVRDAARILAMMWRGQFEKNLPAHEALFQSWFEPVTQ